MKIFLIVLLASLAIPAHSQQDWEAVNAPDLSRVFTLTRTVSGDVLAGCADGGIYRSTDNGVTWAADALHGLTVRRFYHHGGRLFAGMQQGVMWSENDGRTWNSTGTFFNGFGIGANSQGHLYVCGWNGLHRSTDNGATWTIVTDTIHSFRNLQSITINAADHLFIGLHHGGMFRSTDNGQTWEEVDERFRNKSIHRILIDGSVMLAAVTAVGVARSTDDGATWDIHTTEQGIGADFIARGGENEYWAVNNQLVYRSTDGGVQWIKTSNPHFAIHDLLYSDTGLLAATNNQGIHRSSDGVTWTKSNSGLNATIIKDIVLSPDATTIYFSGSSIPIMRSTDNGQTWESCASEMSNTHSLAIGPDNALYAATNSGFWYSTDGGVTAVLDTLARFWSRIHVHSDGSLFSVDWNGLLVYYSPGSGSSWVEIDRNVFSGNRIRCFASVGNAVLVGTHGGMYRTTDNGKTWEKVLQGINENAIVSAMAYHPKYGLLAADIAGQRSIMQSRDQGLSWTSFDPDFHTVNLGIYSIAVSQEGEVAISGDQGVHQYDHQTGSWLPLQLSWGALGFTANNTLYAGTYGNGLWRRSLATTLDVLQPVPMQQSLDHNYPNPFATSSMLPLQIPTPQHVRVTVHDMLGRELRVAHDGWLHDGRHEIQINADGLPSGSYLLRLHAGPLSESRLILVAR